MCETDSTSKVRSAACLGKAIFMNMILFSAPNARLSREHYEVGRYCEISCKVRACSQSALVIIFLFDPYEKETKRNEKNCLIISLLLSDYLIVPLSQQADH